MKHGFTLIELLVVIAIIAILAAILFPVFAMAKMSAKKAADVSNVKQLITGTIMYANDSDEQYPFQCGTDASGIWGWDTGQMLVPYNWSNLSPNAPEYQYSQGFVDNTIQPYVRNVAVFGSPGGTTDPLGPGAGVTAPAGANPAKLTYTYNGLLTAYRSFEIESNATVPVWTAMFGNGAFKGWAISNPVLICTQVGQCKYMPFTLTCSAANNGERSAFYPPTLTYWLFNNGQNWSYADGHAKFRKVGVTSSTTNFYTEPWLSYTNTGVPNSGYWNDGCHVWLFRPDYVPPNGVN